MHPLIRSDLLTFQNRCKDFSWSFFDVEFFVTPIDLVVRVRKIATEYLGVGFLIVCHLKKSCFSGRFVPFLKI